MLSAPSAWRTRSRMKARLFWGAAAVLLAGMLWIARALSPDGRGFGTHVQLGLPACAFQLWSGLPCPGCGLTTAFAHMAQLELVRATHAHVVGVALFLCVLAALPLCSLACLCGAPVEATLKRLRLHHVAAIIGLTAALSWLARIAALP